VQTLNHLTSRDKRLILKYNSPQLALTAAVGLVASLANQEHGIELDVLSPRAQQSLECLIFCLYHLGRLDYLAEQDGLRRP